MRVHIGCGPVYLEGYENIDLGIENHYLATDRPDLVEINKTTVDNYYNNNVTKKDIVNKTYHKQEVVVDKFGFADDLPYKKNSVDEIRSVQLFEHFGYEEGKRVLKHWYSRLKRGGVVHIDIPDLFETVEMYMDAKKVADTKWAMRLLFGSQKNEWGYHRAMYDKRMIKDLLKEVGFIDITFGKNIHFYPAFSVQAIKP